MMRSRPGFVLAAALAVLSAVAVRAHAGSTEPELALAEAVPTVDGGVVSLVVRGNWDYANWVRLGYPIVLVVTQGSTVGRLGFDGSVAVGTGGNPPTPVAGAPGIVALAADRLTAVLPPGFGASGVASVRFEAADEGLVSNSVQVAW